MSTDTIVESVLEDKFRSSYAQLAKERRYSLIGGNFEAIALVVLIVAVVAALHYAFWGAGFSKFSAAQHNASVLMLKNLPGPHLPMLEEDLASKGYISLVDYKDYTQMAQMERTKRLRAERAANGSAFIVDKTTAVDRAVYASEEEALRQLQAEQGRDSMVGETAAMEGSAIGEDGQVEQPSATEILPADLPAEEATQISL